jgi:hypothetical protein
MRRAQPLAWAVAIGAPPAARSPSRRGPAYVAPTAPGQAGGPVRRGSGLADALATAYDAGNERSFPNRLHGRVFLTMDDADFSCSGTAVSSPGRRLVVSAGHCAYDSGWAENWVFVPGYRDGKAPYGRWPATALRAPPQWVNDENISFDVSTATVARNRRGRALQDVVGGRGIGFNQHRDQVYTSYGYPAQPPFDGESLWACRSKYGGDDPSTDPPRTMRIDCDMNAGASGGGWIARGQLLSVNSYCTGLILICLDPTSLYGPYFGDAVRDLYLRSRGRAVRCAGRQVTQLGTAGAETLRGRAGRDVIGLRGSADTGVGRGGGDVLCGGSGNDTLSGGRGHDLCVGGPGRDTARGCEVRRRIP